MRARLYFSLPLRVVFDSHSPQDGLDVMSKGDFPNLDNFQYTGIIFRWAPLKENNNRAHQATSSIYNTSTVYEVIDIGPNSGQAAVDRQGNGRYPDKMPWN